VITADYGEAFADHDRTGHGQSVYDLPGGHGHLR
jgi:hypothetical protein